ncbi:MAG: FHA domain-containing protein [Planctomycetota bacterium]
MPRLQVLNGKRQGAVFEVFPGNEHVIGHRATASIPIDDPWVSWDHARLFFNGQGCYIEDLGSTNGTYVNCVRVKRESLNHEDIIFLGKTHVIFLAPAGEIAIEDSGSGGHLLGGAGFVSPEGQTVLNRDRPGDDWASDLGVFHSASGPTPLVAQPSGLGPSGLGPSGLGPSGAGPSGLGRPGPRDPYTGPKDPFASAPAVRSSGAGGRGRDPFEDSGVDPFRAAADPYGPLGGGIGNLGGGNPAGSGGLGSGGLGSGGLGTLGAPFGGAPPAPRTPTAKLPRDAAPFDLEDDPLFGSDELAAFAPQPYGGSALNPFADDPVESSVIRKNVGGGFHVNDLGPPPPPPPPPPAGLDPTKAPLKKASPFAETRGDEELSPLAARAKPPERSLSLSSISDPTEPEMPGPSTQDIRDLLDASDRHRGLADQLGALDDPLFGLSNDGEGRVPSEMRTRMLDTDRVNELLAEHDAPPPPAAPPPAPAALAALDAPPAPRGIESTHADLLAKVNAEQAGQLAFDRARLEDEVRRLRAALQATQQQNPQAVQLAAQALRDQELGRLAQRVAELERDLAAARTRLEERERELNYVTEEMIEKEDLIDQLQAELEALTGAPEEEDLSSLEF